jgi:soluble lytic murein transglycosylase-like protein
MLTSWILSLMMVLQPQAPWIDTYGATAAAIDQAVSEEASIFPDPDGRAKTAALLVALAWAESTFKPTARGHGGVRGLYQIGGRGDLSDPLKASRVAIELIRESFRLCAARPVNERLAVYAAGGTSCKDPGAEALKKSRYRVWKGLSLVKERPPPAPVLEDAGTAP